LTFSVTGTRQREKVTAFADGNEAAVAKKSALGDFFPMN
jgi:hypothetical protein